MSSLCTDLGKSSVHLWLHSIEKHLSALKRLPGWEPYSTMYVGGGTPSVLPAGVREDLLHLLAAAWSGTYTGSRTGPETSKDPAGGTEWTIECNPDDLDPIMIASFAAFGVSRLSVGIQTLEDPARLAVRRRGKAAEIVSALEKLALFWKQRWSADFMYGLPFQTPAGLAQDIKRVLELGAGHISLYQLSLEDGTVLDSEVRHGRVSLPDQDLAFDQYSAAAEVLRAAGCQRYEVSNWALPGQICLHNMHYWRLDDWDALGPAAVSNRRAGAEYIRGRNPGDDGTYLADPAGAVEFSVIRSSDAMFEFLMMALRTSAGFSIHRFRDIFGRDPVTVFGDLPAAFPDLIREDSGCWHPSDQGLDFLNRVLVAALEALERNKGPSGFEVPTHAEEAGNGGFPQ
jgi:oxygen-independent coproporphyrinogen-3 oxidase